MVTIPWWFVRYGFPALALAVVTAIVLVARPAVKDEESVNVRPQLVQPAPQRAQTKRARASTYSVRSGDTLASIAERLGTTVDRLMELNPGIDPQALRVGQSIHVD
jgi:LysM repeat protein